MRDNLKSQMLDELRDVESRKRNVMIFGMEELPDPTSTDAIRKQDSQVLSDLCSSFGISSPRVCGSFRLGRRHSLPRPLKVQFETASARDDFLRAGVGQRQLKRFSSGSPYNIFIKPDLTPREQEAQRVLRSELLKRRENGELVTIRRGHIVSIPADRSARD